MQPSYRGIHDGHHDSHLLELQIASFTYFCGANVTGRDATYLEIRTVPVATPYMHYIAAQCYKRATLAAGLVRLYAVVEFADASK